MSLAELGRVLGPGLAQAWGVDLDLALAQDELSRSQREAQRERRHDKKRQR